MILNGLKGQYDNVVVVIHVSRNLYDLASISSLLLDAEVRQRDSLFDTSLSAANVVVKSTTEKAINLSIDFRQYKTLDFGQYNTLDYGHPQPPVVQHSHEHQANNFTNARGRGKRRGFGNNKQ